MLAIEERAHELGYDVLLAHTHNLPEREEVVHPPAAVAPGGWPVHFTGLSDGKRGAHLPGIAVARKTPVVLLGPPAPFCSQFVSVQSEELVRQLRRHATSAGSWAIKRIAYFTGPLSRRGRRNDSKAIAARLREAGRGRG